jgi:MFS family permease
VTISSFASYGSGQFLPAYLRSAFGLGLAQVGLIVGLIAGFSAGLGTLVGGFLTDVLGRRSARWYALVPAIGLAVATPLYMLAYLQPDWRRAALILLVPGVFHYTYLAPTFAVVQNSVEARRRATATAILFFFLNLIALGGGPPFTGWVIDRLATWNLAHPEVRSFGASLAGALHLDALPAFSHACPGGAAPKGSGAEAAAACRGVLARSTGQGIIVAVGFYAWASLHYFLAAIGLQRHMRGRLGAA